MLKIKIPT